MCLCLFSLQEARRRVTWFTAQQRTTPYKLSFFNKGLNGLASIPSNQLRHPSRISTTRQHLHTFFNTHRRLQILVFSQSCGELELPDWWSSSQTFIPFVPVIATFPLLNPAMASQRTHAFYILIRTHQTCSQSVTFGCAVLCSEIERIGLECKEFSNTPFLWA